MKIAIIAHSFYPISEPYAGGLEMITHLLTEELVQRGHEVHLYAHEDSDSSLPLIPLTPAKVITDTFTDVNSNYLGIEPQEVIQYVAYSKVMDRIHEENYDIVHNHSLHHVPIIQGNALGKKFITTLHTPDFPQLVLGFRTIGNQRQTVTAVSKKHCENWGKYIDECKVVYNGIDVSAWDYQETAENKLFWMGRMCPEKAPHHAIKVALDTNTPLRLAGPISNEEYYDKEVAPLIDGKMITYLGHLNHEELNREIGSAAATLFTSIWEEPYGLVLAESLACGTPVIGYKIGAAPEIITEETGTLVEPENVEELTQAVQKVKSISRKACRERAESFCSYQSMTDAYEELYRSITEQKTQLSYA